VPPKAPKAGEAAGAPQRFHDEEEGGEGEAEVKSVKIEMKEKAGGSGGKKGAAPSSPRSPAATVSSGGEADVDEGAPAGALPQKPPKGIAKPKSKSSGK